MANYNLNHLKLYPKGEMGKWSLLKSELEKYKDQPDIFTKLLIKDYLDFTELYTNKQILNFNTIEKISFFDDWIMVIYKSKYVENFDILDILAKKYDVNYICFSMPEEDHYEMYRFKQRENDKSRGGIFNIYGDLQKCFNFLSHWSLDYAVKTYEEQLYTLKQFLPFVADNYVDVEKKKIRRLEKLLAPYQRSKKIQKIINKL